MMCLLYLFPCVAHLQGRVSSTSCVYRHTWPETSLGITGHCSCPENLQPCMSPKIEMSRCMTKPTKWLCPQRRLRSAWASTQSDQYSLCAQWVAKDPSFLHADRLSSWDSEDWSDWTDALADPSLRWAHMPFCWFCHEVALIICV